MVPAVWGCVFGHGLGKCRSLCLWVCCVDADVWADLNVRCKLGIGFVQASGYHVQCMNGLLCVQLSNGGSIRLCAMRNAFESFADGCIKSWHSINEIENL